MNVDKVYYEFKEKYPSYAVGIIEYTEDKYNSIKFTFSDGRTAWYYPVEYPVEKKKTKKRT